MLKPCPQHKIDQMVQMQKRTKQRCCIIYDDIMEEYRVMTIQSWDRLESAPNKLIKHDPRYELRAMSP
jgi:hypothetical protein